MSGLSRRIADACRAYLKAYRAMAVPTWGLGEQKDLLAAIEDLREAVAPIRRATPEECGPTEREKSCVDCGPEGPCYMNCGPAMPRMTPNDKWVER